METQKPIVFFDGVCAICNGFIDWLFRVDAKNDRLTFTTIQGETSKEMLPVEQRESISSMIFWVNGKFYSKSTGVIRTVSMLKWYLRPVMGLLLIPTFVRDFVYDMVATNRYSWFGKKETCRLLTPEEQLKFLP